MSKLQALAVTFVFLFPMALFADQIVLKNGDRLTGTIEKSDDKTLIIKTEFAGEVTVQWDAVQEITSTQKLHVNLNDGKTVAGTVTTSDGNLTIATADAGRSRSRKDRLRRYLARRSKPRMRSRCIRACSKDGKAGQTSVSD